jgi:hypothetical protein
MDLGQQQASSVDACQRIYLGDLQSSTRLLQQICGAAYLLRTRPGDLESPRSCCKFPPRKAVSGL